jgi:hypothetical protein
VTRTAQALLAIALWLFAGAFLVTVDWRIFAGYVLWSFSFNLSEDLRA